tara:strand:- start:248 stop:586 length:339 start_codon:yes stop_codon:yes gene_type:complete
MARNKQSVKLPNPANINPPVKSIRALEKKIATVLERKGRFGEKRQILNVESIYYGYHGDEPSGWMKQLLGNRRSISFLRAQLNRDFAGSGWVVTWMDQCKYGYTVKMSYDAK